jgi:hypothetical protein
VPQLFFAQCLHYLQCFGLFAVHMQRVGIGRGEDAFRRMLDVQFLRESPRSPVAAQEQTEAGAVVRRDEVVWV